MPPGRSACALSASHDLLVSTAEREAETASQPFLYRARQRGAAYMRSDCGGPTG